MEKHINEKICNYIKCFKDDIKNLINNENVDINDRGRVQIQNYLDSYSRLELTKQDFVKRKRVKNIVPYYDRCCAKRANGERCTRRRKDDDEYCGTHIKGQPHGVVHNENMGSDKKKKKVVVWAQEIKGMYYYIDDNSNVYEMMDIQEGKENPRIVGKYKLSENGEYEIR